MKAAWFTLLVSWGCETPGTWGSVKEAGAHLNSALMGQNGERRKDYTSFFLLSRVGIDKGAG